MVGVATYESRYLANADELGAFESTLRAARERGGSSSWAWRETPGALRGRTP